MFELTKKGVSNSSRVLDGAKGDQIALLKSDGSWRSGALEFGGQALAFAEDQAAPAGRRALVDLAPELPTGVSMFAAWLALRDWNNAAQVTMYQQ
jgi:hypothetical protein